MDSINNPTRIVLIDDNLDALEVLGMLLELLGYEVYMQSSTQAAMAFLEELQPEVVVSDLGMPGVDGYETAALIRRQSWSQELLLIALSGYDSVEVKNKAQQAGFDYHLKKPLDTHLFEQIIRQHILT